jgi:hypothetical protein
MQGVGTRGDPDALILMDDWCGWVRSDAKPSENQGAHRPIQPPWVAQAGAWVPQGSVLPVDSGGPMGDPTIDDHVRSPGNSNFFAFLRPARRTSHKSAAFPLLVAQVPTIAYKRVGYA